MVLHGRRPQRSKFTGECAQVHGGCVPSTVRYCLRFAVCYPRRSTRTGMAAASAFPVMSAGGRGGQTISRLHDGLSGRVLLLVSIRFYSGGVIGWVLMRLALWHRTRLACGLTAPRRWSSRGHLWRWTGSRAPDKLFGLIGLRSQALLHTEIDMNFII